MVGKTDQFRPSTGIRSAGPSSPPRFSPVPWWSVCLKVLANLRRSIQTLCLRFCDLLYITYEASRRSSGRVPESLGTRCL